MALDLSGIDNDNEFYSDHYLRTTLESDLKDWVKVKRETDGDTPPWQVLQHLGRPYLKCSEEFSRTSTDGDRRLAIQRDFTWQTLAALGYNPRSNEVPLESGILPMISAVEQQDRPHLWIVEAFDAKGAGEDVMQLSAHHSQVTAAPTEATLERLVGETFFTDEPPRWILVVSLRVFVLLDRSKWSGRRTLRISWEEIYNRPTRIATFQLIAMLLSKDSLCPESGRMSVLDDINQQSKAHAQGVSGSLKYALREAVELLGNEYLHYRRSVQRAAIYEGGVDADRLSVECLRYMYRMLFLFTVEARKELGYLPMNASTFLIGYSLERLRDLELVPLKENGSSEGYFIHESLQLLFRLVFKGRSELHRQVEHDDGVRTFEIAPLQCNLFDPDQTPLLNSIKVRNSAWQRIIQMMSLGHENFEGTRHGRRGGRDSGRGRISYAQLGINHLGAVYEALLSYRGFIAQEDLFEVKKRGDSPNALSSAYFVNQDSLEKHYDDSERVFDAEGRLVRHPRGTFIYRLTGRAREESASYYTPESLTQCVVKYALEEVLDGKKANDILKITVCEPAMGSAAFLNEAVSQLAEAYLDRKSRERNETLTADRYAFELQRVKMYLADNNVYGVDLNPTAVELGGVSLWLNTLVPGGFVPWFGNQLKRGNSLVGVWRRVYSRRDLEEGKWWMKAPCDIHLAAARPRGTVYHFLVGDRGMAEYRGKAVKQIASGQLKTITAWRKDFTAKVSAGELALLEHLSTLIDQLWQRHVRDQRRLEMMTTDSFPVYPSKGRGAGRPSNTRQKDKQLRSFLAPAHGHNASAYQRLKLVMDYWCALWYWPIEKAGLLPERREYLSDLSRILAGRGAVLQTNVLDEPQAERDELGYVDLQKLVAERPRLKVVQKQSGRFRFHHWQLEYADQFEAKGGFDVVIGNPPWKKVKWIEKHVIADSEPRFMTKKFTASQTAELRSSWLDHAEHRASYLSEFAAVAAEAAFLNATQNYPLLSGMQSNLYKSFLAAARSLSVGSVGLLHPNGVYDDPKGGPLREALYPRLRRHFRFQNALKLFPEVHGETRFSVNVYGQPNPTPSFSCISYLLHPTTVEASFRHLGVGPVPGIKTDNNEWELAGHSARLIKTGVEELELYAALYDQPGTPGLQARLPAIHSKPVLQALKRLAHAAERLRDFAGQFSASRMWYETNTQKEGIIHRSTQFADSAAEWILNGPHFFVGNPLYQSPNDGCATNTDYSRLDLTCLPVSYRPRTNYAITCKQSEYTRRTPRTPWRKPLTDHYRLAYRRRLSTTGERTLILTAIPPEVAHIDAVCSIAFRELKKLVRALQGWLTLIVDFYVKTTGKSDLLGDSASSLPLLPFGLAAAARVLGLVCLTTDYRDLWNTFVTADHIATWAKPDPRLDRGYFTRFKAPWQHQSALRTDYERRQALIELDVLCAQELGITFEELCSIYRIQFPVLKSYENDTWYDTKGRIVFSRKNGEGGLPRKRRPKDTAYGIKGKWSNISLGWEDIRHMQEGIVTFTFMDDTLPGGPFERTIEYHAPFDKCDREEDYREAWEHFECERSLGSL